jgi:menaquinone-dependent protoporphyrinogen oxidase
MTILIAVASRHGSTREIADALAHELRDCGQAVVVRNADAVGTTDRYDAAIVGSAIYMGAWLPEARRFVERQQAQLRAVPVWLFSSGPLGDEDPQPRGDPAHLAEMMQATRARGHRIFVGKLAKDELGLGERLAVKMVKAPDGDFRDWDAIRGWAREIATAVMAPAGSGA